MNPTNDKLPPASNIKLRLIFEVGTKFYDRPVDDKTINNINHYYLLFVVYYHMDKFKFA